MLCRAIHNSRTFVAVSRLPSQSSSAMCIRDRNHGMDAMMKYTAPYVCKGRRLIMHKQASTIAPFIVYVVLSHCVGYRDMERTIGIKIEEM